MQMTQRPPVLAIVGATASGKTALGIGLAKVYDGEVVSADSMQLYQGLPIATAKPTPAEMEGVPHHLISVQPPDQPCSVVEYVAMAETVIADIHARGKLPILVGGTGLYIDSLLDHIRFPEIPAAPALRARLEQEAETLGRAVLLERLRQCDAESAAKLHENNLRRVIRALEVYELTGIPLSEHARRSRSVPSPWEIVRIGIGFQSRAQLNARIDQRIKAMVAQGLPEEVLAEAQSGRRRATAAAAIGYKELLPWVRGEAPLTDCLARVRQETCRYAKRQGTWFRRNEQILWLYRDNVYENVEILEKCQKMIAKTGLLCYNNPV